MKNTKKNVIFSGVGYILPLLRRIGDNPDNDQIPWGRFIRAIYYLYITCWFYDFGRSRCRSGNY